MNINYNATLHSIITVYYVTIQCVLTKGGSRCHFEAKMNTTCDELDLYKRCQANQRTRNGEQNRQKKFFLYECIALQEKGHKYWE